MMTNQQIDKSLSRYVDILADAGITRGLIGPREAERLWDRHIDNSLALADLLPQGVSVADVGSGAGLPGIPLAIARPDITMTLVESLQRRTSFLQEVIDDLGLGDRVTVIRSRAEDLDQHFDVVVARAVARIDKLIRWTRPLFWPDGELLALKGDSAPQELSECAPALLKAKVEAEVLTVRTSNTSEPTHVIRARRKA